MAMTAVTWIFNNLAFTRAGWASLLNRKELEESMGKASSKHSPKAQGFFDGVKKFFDDLTN
jgi:hypothetical protein